MPIIIPQKTRAVLTSNKLIENLKENLHLLDTLKADLTHLQAYEEVAEVRVHQKDCEKFVVKLEKYILKYTENGRSK